MPALQSLVLSQLLRVESSTARATALDVILAGGRWSSAGGGLLAELGAVNLSQDRATIDRLLKATRIRLPKTSLSRRMLRFGKHREEMLLALIRSLAGTPRPEITAALTEVVEANPSESSVQLAKENKDRLEAMALQVDAKKRASLEGDLELFGLPNLIQSLAITQASGALTLESREEARTGVIRLSGGQFVDCKVGELRGPEAMYLLLEKPLPSTFKFIAEKDPQMAKAPRDPKPILLEGMRRHDEFERLRLLLPDDTVLEVSGERGGTPPEEQDGILIHQLWTALKDGKLSGSDCDDLGLADPYRIRKILLHWLESGVLRRAEST